MCLSQPRDGDPSFRYAGGGPRGSNGSTSFTLPFRCRPGPLSCRISVHACLHGTRAHACPFCAAPLRLCAVMEGGSRRQGLNSGMGITNQSMEEGEQRVLVPLQVCGALSPPLAQPGLSSPMAGFSCCHGAVGALGGELWEQARGVARGRTCSLWSVSFLVHQQQCAGGLIAQRRGQDRRVLVLCV